MLEIPNYTLACDHGQLELLYDMAKTAEGVKAIDNNTLGTKIIAQALRIKLGKRKEEGKKEYDIKLKPIEAVSLWKMLNMYAPHAKGQWQKDVVKTHQVSLMLHFKPFLNSNL